MSRLSWQNDPHGCFADYENERIAEAMYAAHLEGECSQPCEWCEAAKQADAKAQAENEQANLPMDFKRQVERWADEEKEEDRGEK